MRAEIKSIARDRVNLVAVITAILLIIFLRFLFIPFSRFLSLNTGISIGSYYSVIAITLVSLIPILTGALNSSMVLVDVNSLFIQHSNALSSVEHKNLLFRKTIYSAFLSFAMLWLTIFFTDPVPSEGWLRTVYISGMLSVQAPLMLLIISTTSVTRLKHIVVSLLVAALIATIPYGLLIHHPWNYVAFFSPFYWIGWAWVTDSPKESLLYGLICMMITCGCIFWFLTRYLRNFKK